MAGTASKIVLGIFVAAACFGCAVVYQVFFRDRTAIHVSEGELRRALRAAPNRGAVERTLAHHGIVGHWFPEERALRGTVRDTEGTTALQSVVLTFEAAFDEDGKLVRSEVHGGVVGL